MKYSVAILALVAAASAQSINDIPKCAQPCIDASRTKDTSCSATDFKCICDNIDKLTADGTSCVLSACGADTALNEVLPGVKKFCAAVSAAPASSTPASTPVASSSAASTPAASSSAAGYPTEGTTSKPTVTPTQSSHPVSTTSAPTYPAGGNSTSTPTHSSSTLIPTAGAAVAGSVGGLAMLALGALAAF